MRTSLGNVTSYAGRAIRCAANAANVIVYEIVISRRWKRRRRRPQQPVTAVADCCVCARPTRSVCVRPTLRVGCQLLGLSCVHFVRKYLFNYSVFMSACVCVFACACDTGPTHVRPHARKSSATYETTTTTTTTTPPPPTTLSSAQTDSPRGNSLGTAGPADRITHLWQTIIVMFITVNAPEMLSTIYASSVFFFCVPRCVRFCRVAVFVWLLVRWTAIADGGPIRLALISVPKARARQTLRTIACNCRACVCVKFNGDKSVRSGDT